ncbi:hypothetical protein NDU88_006799 [Pleurodeles waltl]|uniref:Uncharacterized protein n=1 Tax=Pleurodeles waltl TaxID=8319 RepID=A0AAV7MGT3_PLEWA|nr:hypothetical protein NDU88_006799 [Pleurodeles waltl]
MRTEAQDQLVACRWKSQAACIRPGLSPFQSRWDTGGRTAGGSSMEVAPHQGLGVREPSPHRGGSGQTLNRGGKHSPRGSAGEGPEGSPSGQVRVGLTALVKTPGRVAGPRRRLQEQERGRPAEAAEVGPSPAHTRGNLRRLRAGSSSRAPEQREGGTEGRAAGGDATVTLTQPG